MVEVFIGLGSNIGDKRDNLTKCIELLKEKTKLVKVSSLYETEPMYLKEQAWFVNCVVKLETNLMPKELLDYLQDIERQMGRRKDVRNGPRIIDLDLLFYGNKVVEDGDLKIPHPRIHERRFVLIPLAEIDRDHIHPVYRKNISALLANLNSDESVQKLGEFF